MPILQVDVNRSKTFLEDMTSSLWREGEYSYFYFQIFVFSDCSFVDKIINAENAGALIALVTDSKKGKLVFFCGQRVMAKQLREKRSIKPLKVCSC